MEIKRYYPKGFRGKTYSDEYIDELEERGVNVELIDTAKKELVLSKEEQKRQYEQNLKEIIEEPRKVLDSLEERWTYRVDWQSYGSRRLQPKKHNLLENNSISPKDL